MYKHTPTSRLVIFALAQQTAPLSTVELAIATGATPGTLELILRRLTRAGLILRTPGKIARYESVPAQTEVLS